MTTHYSAACYSADRAAPYLAVGRATMRVVWTREVPIAAADRAWRLYLNPDRFGALTVPEAAYVLLHELGHVVRQHADRCDRLGADPRVWNIAADAELNSADWPGLACPACGVTPDRLDMPRGLLAEDYYRRLAEQAEREQCQQGQSAGAGDPQDGDGQASGGNHTRSTPPDDAGPGHGAGSASDGIARPWEFPADDEEAPGLTGAAAGAARQAVAEAIRQYVAQHGRGTAPGGWGLWAESVLAPAVPWQARLRASITSGLTRVGLGAQSYSRTRLRHGVCLPRHVRRVPIVAVVADTSGSMGSGAGTPWHRALSEVIGIARTVGTVTVLWTDAEVRVQRNVHSLADCRPSGGGGTDMRAGIAAAAALRNGDRPDIIITLTDGETPWPATAPAAKHIAVIVTEHGSAPEWGEVVRIGGER